MADYDVIVIGAGVGGLTAGALLAKQGRSVLVLEQNDRVGGCCSSFEKEGFVFDAGAAFVGFMDPVYMAFEKMGTTLQEQVDLIPQDSVGRYYFKDGSQLRYTTSMEATAEVVSRFSPEDAEGFRKYADRASGLWPHPAHAILYNRADSILDLLKVISRNPSILKYYDFYATSYREVVAKYFKTNIMQLATGMCSHYAGMPAEEVCGLFGLYPYMEHGGIWYPKGGMIAIPEALRRCGEGMGMELRMSCSVDKVMVRDRKVEGIVLSDGTMITAPVVVSNVAVKTLYLDLIGEEHLPWIVRRGVNSYIDGGSAVRINLGIDYEPPLEGLLNLVGCSSLEDLSHYWNNQHVAAKDPRTQPFVTTWATKADPSLAPEGCHILNLLWMVPYHLSGTDWDKEKERFAEQAIEYLSEEALPGLSDHIKVIDVFTPLDYHRDMGIREGCFLGPAFYTTQMACFRASNKSKSIKGLYLAGSSTHPGGIIPFAVASGVNATELVQQCER